MDNNSLALKASKRAKVVKKSSRIVFSVFRFFFLVCIAYIVVYPLLYMFISSISTNEAFLNSRRTWIPTSVTLEYFGMVAEFMEYGKSIASTLLYQVVGALIEVCSCAVVAYGFSRFEFRFKKLFTSILFLTILVPSAMIIIPLTVNYSHLDVLGILGLVYKITGIDLRINILNSPLSFWLPSLFAAGLRSGIMIYIYMQFFKNLPKEFEEAAWVDGATPMRTFLQIIIPSSSVVILTVTVFSVIWHWNDYQLAVMFMNKNFPLSVSLSNLEDLLTTKGYWTTGGDPTAIALMMAACLLFILPPLVMYIFIQHWFIESVDRVGITG